MRILVIVFCLVSVLYTEAAEVNKVYRGKVSLPGTITTVTICDTIDLDASILFFSLSCNDATTSGIMVAGRLSDNQTIEFRRDGTSATVELAYQVIEFSSGVTVQRGVTNVNSNTVNVGINAVDLSKSFAIATMYNNGVTYGTDDGVTANLTSTTNLQFATSASGFTTYWQVVEYDSCSVQKITPTLTGTNVTSTITSVDMSKTMIVTNHTVGGNVNADDLPRTSLSNSTTVSIDRVGSTRTLDFVGYVVEFTDRTTVQRANLNFGSSDQIILDTVATAANDSSALLNCPGNFGRQGSTSFSSTDNMGHGWFQYEVVNDSVVRLLRQNTGSTATATYELVNFVYNQTRTPSFTDVNPAGPYDDIELVNLQRGTANLGAGATVLNVTINSVDLTKSFLVFESSTNDADPRDFNITGQLTSATNIQFQRTSGGNLSNINWKVVEFLGDITVQRGATTVGATTTNQAITSVDLQKSFVLHSIRGGGTAMGDDDFVIAQLTSATNLQLRAEATGAIVEWQVIEYDDSYVRQVTTTLPNGQNTKTFNINDCSSNFPDPAKTMIVASHTSPVNLNADDLPRFELVDSTAIVMTRTGTVGDLDVLVYVIEFLDSTTVNSGLTTLTGGATAISQAISSVDTAKSIAISTGNMQKQGSTSFTTDDNPGYANFGLALTAPTNLSITRIVGGTSTGSAPWQVVNFKRGQEPLPVELVYFRLDEYSNGIANLSWASATEFNTSHYIVEMGTDLFNFEPVSKIAAKGKSSRIESYNTAVPVLENGNYYFRLKMLDFDGSYEYSDLVHLKVYTEGQYHFYPNPTNSVFNFENKSDESIQFELRNTQGLLIQSGRIASFESIQIGEGLVPGSYFVRLWTKQFQTTEVLLKL